jgi:Ulp1 family protease
MMIIDSILAVFDSLKSEIATETISDHLSDWLYHRLGIPDAERSITIIQAKVGLCFIQTIHLTYFPLQVPQQPNFFDCGAYVLHFAKTFFSDAEAYTTHIQVIFEAFPLLAFHSAHLLQSQLSNKKMNAVWRARHISSVREGLRKFIQETAEFEL